MSALGRSSPCENSNACRARRNILEKLRIMRTDAAADIRLDAVLENCIFYISPMYEFLHSLGQSLPSWPRPKPLFVRFCEGFRMPAYDGRHREHRGWGPAFENLQGRKSREGIRRRCGALYGDLAAARGVADGSRWG